MFQQKNATHNISSWDVSQTKEKLNRMADVENSEQTFRKLFSAVDNFYLL